MIFRSFVVLGLCLSPVSHLWGDVIYLTTDATETLGGISVRNGDIAQYDTVADSAKVIFSEDLFTANETVDAFQLLVNGNLLLSTAGDATLGGLSFNSGDIVEYNPLSDTATLFFDSSLFSSAENIDAFHFLSDGTLLLSTENTATLGSLTFTDGDVAQYTMATDTSTLFFDESLFSADEDIDGVHLTDAGTLLISTVAGATLGGLSFVDGDIVEYNMVSDNATLFFAETTFGGGADVNGLFVPESTVNLLWVAGLLAGLRRPGRSQVATSAA